MAAIDLSSTATFPRTYTEAGVTDGVWQEFALPTACKRVSVEGEGQAIVVAWDADGAVDDAAVGTHRKKVPADTTMEFRRDGRRSSKASASIFVAGDGGAATVTLVLESE